MKSSESSLVAFFSYARLNDEHDRGKLTSLRKLLQTELWVQAGKPLRIFQDQENIEWGAPWMEHIKKALSSCSIFIAIVTPSYLASQPCRFEFEYFLHQESLSTHKLILPILYIDTPGLKDKRDQVAVEISKRQWIDWRDLRFASLTSAKVTKKLASLAKQIYELMDDQELPDSAINTLQNNTPPEAVARMSTGQDIQILETTNLDKQRTVYSRLSVPSETPEVDKNPLQITITLRPTGDKDRDRRRIKAIYGILISFHGRDHFSFQIIEDRSGYLIDFPEDSTRVCPELLARLKKLIGEESWRVEEIA